MPYRIKWKLNLCVTCNKHFNPRRINQKFCSIRCKSIINHSKESLSKRFFQKINKTLNCWIWVAHIHSSGYGSMTFKNKAMFAHRASYFLFNGNLIKGLSIDHICRNKLCVNPKHLRQVTKKQNALENSNSPSAINSRKKNCIRGHEFNKENTYVRPDRNGRMCRVCRGINNAKI